MSFKEAMIKNAGGDIHNVCSQCEEDSLVFDSCENPYGFGLDSEDKGVQTCENAHFAQLHNCLETIDAVERGSFDYLDNEEKTEIFADTNAEIAKLEGVLFVRGDGNE